TLGVKLNRLMRAEGFNEAFNYAFVDGKKQSLFLGDVSSYKHVGFNFRSEAVPVRNPLTEEMNVMRQQIAYGLFVNTQHNLRYGQLNGKLFELGFNFEKNNEAYNQIWSMG